MYASRVSAFSSWIHPLTIMVTSPLAIVAIGGLMVSTFLTLIYVPMFYELFEQGRVAVLSFRLNRSTPRKPEYRS